MAPPAFYGCTGSFVVSKEKIEAFSPSEVEIYNKAIPVGRNYKEQVLASLQRPGNL